MAKIISGVLIISLFAFSACNKEETASNEKILRENPAKEVQTFIAGSPSENLFLEKTASSSAESTITIIPELNGRIQNLNVQVGDEVRANQILATLGGSQSIAQLELQNQTAAAGEKLARISEELTKYAASQNVDAAQLGVVAARTAYENALKSRENIIKSFELQYESAEIESENADLSVENTRDSIDALEEALDDLYDLDLDTPEIEAQIDTLENQIDNAEIALDIAENRYEQSQIGLDQLVAGTESQLAQIDSGIENAIIQYQSAINQLESAQVGAQLQKIGAETGSLQSESNLKSTIISLDSKNLRSPIAGRISEIAVKEGQSVSPGQVVIKIENDETLIIKTTVNAEEAELISKNSDVEIIYNKKTFTGQIVSIGQSLNTKNKIEVEISTSKNLKLKAGAFVKVRIATDSKENFFIPLNSVFLNEGKKTVRLVDEKNRVKYSTVEIGEIVGNSVEILEGIKRGDQIITSVDKFLSEGEKVKITNERTKEQR